MKGKLSLKFQMWIALGKFRCCCGKRSEGLQQDAACLGPRLSLHWTSRCQPGVGAGPQSRWEEHCCCLWVSKLQRNTLFLVFLQKVIKCYCLAFMTLFSFKALHFPIEEPELIYMVDLVGIAAKGAILRRQKPLLEAQVYWIS